MADYFSQTDLENALSTAVVKGAYDDDHDGSPDAGAIAACVAYGGAMCDSFLRNVTVEGAALSLPLTTVPNEVKFAALDFGIAYTMRRRPDIVRAMGEQNWTVFYDQAVAQMKRYCASVQRVPTTTGDHATVGGSLLNPATDDDGEEEEISSEGRWADMGDYG